jgi:hypothetical protein
MENVQTSRSRSWAIGLLALAILVALVAAVSAYASSGSSTNGTGSSSTPSQPGLMQTQDSQSPQQQPNGDDCPNGGGQRGQGKQGQGQQQDQSTAPDTTTQTPTPRRRPPTPSSRPSSTHERAAPQRSLSERPRGPLRSWTARPGTSTVPAPLAARRGGRLFGGPRIRAGPLPRRGLATCRAGW